MCKKDVKSIDKFSIENLLKQIVPNENLHTVDVENFTKECTDMIKLYAKKNHDYGDSFNKGMDAIGLPYSVGRMFDKMNRIMTLMKVKAEIDDESIVDTIRDLACYSIMTVCYITNPREEK